MAEEESEADDVIDKFRHGDCNHRTTCAEKRSLIHHASRLRSRY